MSDMPISRKTITSRSLTIVNACHDIICDSSGALDVCADAAIQSGHHVEVCNLHVVSRTKRNGLMLSTIAFVSPGIIHYVRLAFNVSPDLRRQPIPFPDIYRLYSYMRCPMQRRSHRHHRHCHYRAHS
jgi:hypothetical protein